MLSPAREQWAVSSGGRSAVLGAWALLPVKHNTDRIVASAMALLLTAPLALGFEVASDMVAEAEDARVHVELWCVEVFDREVAGVAAVTQPAKDPVEVHRAFAESRLEPAGRGVAEVD